jgi:hypothetical protein
MESLLALRTFPVNNVEAFHKYSEFHAIITRHKHEPVADVTIYQKEYSILEQNFIPYPAPKIKCLSPNSKKLKILLTIVLVIRNFCLAV